MKFHYANLENCHVATGVVIVIDVLRAFSTAAYAFANGADKIILTGDVEEALSLKSQIPNAKVMGEVGGLPPKGFDFGNSPTHIHDTNLSGSTIIQRTGAGTQGAVRCKQADALLAASFVVVNATVQYVKTLAPSDVTFVVTGQLHRGGDEDLACAEYLEHLLSNKQVEAKPYLQRVYDSNDAIEHLDPQRPEFPVTDLEYCTQLNAFNFAMPINTEDGLLVMRSITIPTGE